MFIMFQNEEGAIDLREYVIALSVVCRPSKTLETIQLAFEASSNFSMLLVVNLLWCIELCAVIIS